MKVLAVIPARENSKRIPNKTLRIINDRPLIYYVISTALKSKYITKIVVTTDSSAVITLCEQMGVPYLIRDEKLCTDETTLDAVVYDVAERYDSDYIVTIQPTSPLLTVESLDDAIEKTIMYNYDTTIAVVNHPRLRWVMNDTKAIPEYTCRLNSQYLASQYQETGAFIISKKAVTTPKSRIGSRVKLYELFDEEAITVDTFQDLALVDMILSQKRVAIFVNGNSNIGLGHIYRVLELADEFYCKPDIYFDVNQTDIGVWGKTNHHLIPVQGIEGLLTSVMGQGYGIFINDILSTSVSYMKHLRKAIGGAKIVNFEDRGEGGHLADLVINALYSDSVLPNVCYGAKYYIAPKEFLLYEPIKINPFVKIILITFGGADPQNYTDKILEIITANSKEYSEYKFCVVLGKAKRNITQLMKYSDYKNIEVMVDIHDMPRVMSKCDIAITSRGRTCYELAMLGIPSISLAQNKREEEHNFACHENGFDYLGLAPGKTVIKANLDLYLKMKQKDRQKIQKKMLAVDLRNGRDRVMHLIHSL